jgi:hypothetical protein
MRKSDLKCFNRLLNIISKITDYEKWLTWGKKTLYHPAVSHGVSLFSATRDIIKISAPGRE